MTKFRKWLIKKLGGYTDKWEAEPFRLEVSRVEPISLSLELRSYKDFFNTVSSEEASRYEELENKKAAKLLADRIFEDNLLTIGIDTFQSDASTTVKKYIIRIVPPQGYVYPRDDLAPLRKEKS